MLPSPKQFKTQMEQLDLRLSDTIVFYEQDDLHAAARSCWVMKVFGFENAYILNGPLRKWSDDGRDVVSSEEDETEPRAKEPLERFKKNNKLVFRYEDFFGNHRGPDIMLDARPNFLGAFEHGIFPEGDNTFEHGNVPKAISLPYYEVMNMDKTLKSDEELYDIFKKLGKMKDPTSDSAVVMSETAISACILDLALQ
jgi:thiosulfate/3-mercaptopyruvate sulfurtransferase